MKELLCLVVVIFSLAQISGDAQTDSKDKTTTLKGKVYRQDKGHPVPEAVVLLLDEERSDKKDNSVQANANSQGDFIFEKVKQGKHTVSIRTWHGVMPLVLV